MFLLPDTMHKLFIAEKLVDGGLLTSLRGQLCESCFTLLCPTHRTLC